MKTNMDTIHVLQCVEAGKVFFQTMMVGMVGNRCRECNLHWPKSNLPIDIEDCGAFYGSKSFAFMCPLTMP